MLFPLLFPIHFAAQKNAKMILHELFPFLLALCSHSKEELKQWCQFIIQWHDQKDPSAKFSFTQIIKNYCCKDTNILTKTFSFQKSFQIRATCLDTSFSKVIVQISALVVQEAAFIHEGRF